MVSTSGQLFRVACIVYILKAAEALLQDENVRVLFGNIKEINIDTGAITKITQNESVVRDIDYDYKNRFVYWTDDRKGAIYRIHYPLQQNVRSETVAKTTYPRGIVVDPELGHVYWTEYYNHRIMRCTLEGNDVTVWLETDVNYPHAISLDKDERWLYFSQVGDRKRIEKIMLDGTNRQIVISQDIGSVMDIDIDEDRLYWTDDYRNSIRSSKLDGSDVKVVTKAHSPGGIDVLGKYIYYTDWYNGQVLRVDKSKSSEPSTCYSGHRGDYLYAIFVYNREDTVTPSKSSRSYTTTTIHKVTPSKNSRSNTTTTTRAKIQSKTTSSAIPTTTTPEVQFVQSTADDYQVTPSKISRSNTTTTTRAKIQSKTTSSAIPTPTSTKAQFVQSTADDLDHSTVNLKTSTQDCYAFKERTLLLFTIGLLLVVLLGGSTGVLLILRKNLFFYKGNYKRIHFKDKIAKQETKECA